MIRTMMIVMMMMMIKMAMVRFIPTSPLLCHSKLDIPQKLPW